MLLTGFVSVACGSQKTAVRQDSVPQQADGAFTPETYFKKVVDNSCHEKCLTAKVKCEIQMDGNSISTSGTLRMKKDGHIQSHPMRSGCLSAGSMQKICVIWKGSMMACI